MFFIKLTRDHRSTTKLPNLAVKDLRIKDPGLIKFKEYEKISDKDYNAKYFHKLSEITDSYAVYLYESYANEYLYRENGDKKYLKRAKNAIILSNSLEADNKYIKEQLEDLKLLETL